MDDRRIIFKAFISSMITLIFLYIMLCLDISFIPSIVKSISAVYLLFVFMIHITFLCARILNVRNIFKGIIGKNSALLEDAYIKFGILNFLMPLIIILVLINPTLIEE